MYEGISSVRERCGQVASHGSGGGRKVIIRRSKTWMKRKARCGRVVRSPSASDAASRDHILPCGDTTKCLELALADISVSILEHVVPKATQTAYLQSPKCADYQRRDVITNGRTDQLRSSIHGFLDGITFAHQHSEPGIAGLPSRQTV